MIYHSKDPEDLKKVCLMNKINFLIFDFDGTLVDTGPDIIRAVNLFLKDEGKAELDEKTILNFVGTGLRDLLKQIMPEVMENPGEMRSLEFIYHFYYIYNFMVESLFGVFDKKVLKAKFCLNFKLF